MNTYYINLLKRPCVLKILKKNSKCNFLHFELLFINITSLEMRPFLLTQLNKFQSLDRTLVAGAHQRPNLNNHNMLYNVEEFFHCLKHQTKHFKQRHRVSIHDWMATWYILNLSAVSRWTIQDFKIKIIFLFCNSFCATIFYLLKTHLELKSNGRLLK